MYADPEIKASDPGGLEGSVVVEQLSLVTLAQQINALIRKSRSGTIVPEDSWYRC